MTRSTIMLAAIAALAIASAATAQQQIPVQFAKGTSTATIAGTITGDVYRDYLVAARAGQTLAVSMKTSNPSAYFNVLPPGSQGEASFIGSTEGNSHKGPIAADGDTAIRVYLMRSAGRRGESSNYTLTVGVTGAASTDALVPGTGFNATAMIRCAAEPSKPLADCKAGVKRIGGGSGVVTVTTPDGGSRTINFRGGAAVSSDSATNLSVERRGDVSVVRIGATEVYEIPDAFVLGG
jgi:hypothetical protein